jgi:carboxyl-terminal processing protease
MHSWVFAPRLLLKILPSQILVWLLIAALVSTSAADRAQAQIASSGEQVNIAPEVLPNDALSGVLAKGRELEASRRWGDALTHYEESLREHRDSAVLQQRHDLAKLHYSLERRYHDHSFLESISVLNRRQALSLYSELLQKTNSHYVHTPPWTLLAQRGMAALDVALLDPDFAKANRLQVSRDQISQLLLQLHQSLDQQPIGGSRDLVALADDAAQMAEARLRVPATATILEFVTAAANGLDDYSSYLTSDQLREVYSQIEGNFVGLGVELKAENGALLIVHVIPGSPAEQSAILSGDRIVAVDGKSTSEMSTDEAATMLTGAEGTWVRVTVYTPGQQPRVLNVRREHVEVPSLEGARIIDPDFGIAYVRIPTFQKTTSRDLEAALWDLHRQGMRSLILDLRGNPGGLLTASVEVADKFLTEGNIVSTRGRSPQEDFNYQAHYGGTWRVPLVVLIDRDSASASEIFAGAIKDNNRGRVVGETSFGKGSVQGIFPLGYAGAGIRLTTAKFYSPNNVAISHRGVEPHVRVQVTARPTAEGLSHVVDQNEDSILQAGLEAARSRVASR